MPSAWDDNANTNLLLSIIEILNPKPPKWDEVSAMIATKGYDFTKEACRQHYQKLRKDAKQASGAAGSSAPRKATPSKSAPCKPTPRKRAAKSIAMDGDDDEDGDLSEVPLAKKRKQSAVKPKKKEVESQESDGGMAVKAEEHAGLSDSPPYYHVSGDEEF